MSVVQVTTDSNASLITNYNSTATITYKELLLPTLSNDDYGRVFYLKEAAEDQGPPVFSVVPQAGDFIQNSTILYLHSNESVTLQYFKDSNYGILGGYPGVSTFLTCLQSNANPAAAVAVNPSLLNSLWFVDLQTQSKVLVLPPIASILTSSALSPFYTIKDIYGSAATNNLYISSIDSDILEHSTINGCIRINQAYASIDIAANLFLNKWHILNYYDGTLVANPP